MTEDIKVIDNKEDNKGQMNLLIEKYKKDNKPIKLNIACGQIRQEGFIGVDKVKTDATDIVHDLDIVPWSFIPDNCVDEITCSHYIEHVQHQIPFMDELCRIMKQGAKATIVAPYYTSMRAWQDPTHVRAICEASFLYYNKQWRETNKLDHYGIKSDFDFSYGYQLYPDWAARSQEARDFAVKHYWNVISDIYVTLTKR